MEILTAEVIREVVPQRCSVEKWTAIFSALQSNDSAVLVAERSGLAIGFVQFGLGEQDQEVGELHRFYVSPPEWGMGAAQLLMDTALTSLAEDGRSVVALWTPATPRARRFYERNGFRATGVARDLALTPEIQVTDYEFTRSPTGTL